MGREGEGRELAPLRRPGVLGDITALEARGVASMLLAYCLLHPLGLPAGPTGSRRQAPRLRGGDQQLAGEACSHLGTMPRPGPGLSWVLRGAGRAIRMLPPNSSEISRNSAESNQLKVTFSPRPHTRSSSVSVSDVIGQCRLPWSLSQRPRTVIT